MTIQKAIKSGRPFKRPCYEGWLTVGKDSDGDVVIKSWNDERSSTLLPSAVLATDWIVAPPKSVVITKAQLDIALCEAGYAVKFDKLNKIAKKLGLE